MEQKLGFLRKYKRNAQLISCHEINKLDCGKIPNSWYELFQEEKVDKRVESILSIWKEQVGAELRNTISYLSRHLEEVELMDINGRYSILYTIKTDNGEILYYEGEIPKMSLIMKNQKNLGIRFLQQYEIFIELFIMVSIFMRANLWVQFLQKM